MRVCGSSATVEEISSNVGFVLARQILALWRGCWQTRRVIIGLFPELDAPGGVQRAGRHLAAVLTEFAASRGMECRLISLNDSQELHRMSVGGREFVFTGCDGGKGRFTATALRAARRKAKLVDVRLAAGRAAARESGAGTEPRYG
jgi:hypothetical protein